MGRTKRRASVAVSAWSRSKKLDHLLARIPEGASVLLVGVSPGSGLGTDNQVERGLVEHANAVGVVYQPLGPVPPLSCPLVRGDACALPFATDSFDYVVTNAVIEHVGGLEGATLLLQESARVARVEHIHTTPNRRFPVETHTQVLFLHWAPRRWQQQIFKSVAGKNFPVQEYWLYTARSFKDLLSPAASVTNLGLTLIARVPADG